MIDDVTASTRRKQLRLRAQAALATLGQGFLAHPGNTTLREALARGSLSTNAYADELARLVFRLIFLHSFEDSDLLERVCSVARELNNPTGASSATDATRDRDSHIWEAMSVVFKGLANGEERLALPPLGGLFTAQHCRSVDAARLDNESLLTAMSHLASLDFPAAASRVGSAAVGAEELGAVYEALLEGAPQITQSGGVATFIVATAKHNARRVGGIYYTASPQVKVVIDSTLEPVVQTVMAANVEQPADALLELTILDPACGTGNILLAAARQLATHIARCRANGSAGEADYRHALRDVVSRCIYGVDVDPIAVALCRAALWLEVGDPSLPVAFLDLRIRTGNALVGSPFFPTAPTSAVRAKRAATAALTMALFDWASEYPHVFERGGFDVVVGNPPWIAHAGRAAQPLEPEVKRYYQRNYAAFAGYPTTHGMFITRAADLLRPGGMLGLVIPSSVSELDGYRATRAAHDEVCSFPAELIDFGEGAIDGVTQPCMALVSRRIGRGRIDAVAGDPWPMRRPDLDATARGLLAKLAKLPPLPPELFGERGVQSDRAMAEHFLVTPKPVGRFATPIREGKDVREFQLLPPQNHVDRSALGSRMRGAEEYGVVRVVVRQTARYPIAALSDGCAFRNSLLAVFETALWPAHAMVALLNSATIRWLHYMRFRDARQPVMPQVKIRHLRSLPDPVEISPDERQDLAGLGERLSLSNGGSVADRQELDELVADIYGLDGGERSAVETWRTAHAMGVASQPHGSRGTRAPGKAASTANGMGRL